MGVSTAELFYISDTVHQDRNGLGMALVVSEEWSTTWLGL